MQGIWFVIGSVIANVAGQFFLKSGVAKAGLKAITFASVLKTILTPLVIAGFIFYGVSSIFWIIALSKQELSVAYPILLSLGLISIALISWIFLQEEMNSTKIAGIILIAIGVYFVFKSS